GETLAELSSRILRDEPDPLRRFRPDVPAELEETVARCLRKDREERFPDVAALVRALAGFASAGAVENTVRIRALGSLEAPAPGRSEAAEPPAVGRISALPAAPAAAGTVSPETPPRAAASDVAAPSRRGARRPHARVPRVTAAGPTPLEQLPLDDLINERK